MVHGATDLFVEYRCAGLALELACDLKQLHATNLVQIGSTCAPSLCYAIFDTREIPRSWDSHKLDDKMRVLANHFDRVLRACLTPERLLRFTLTVCGCRRWAGETSCRDARPPEEIPEDASRSTQKGMLEAGEVCSGITILDDDGYPSCHETNVTNPLMYSSNEGVCTVMMEGRAVESMKETMR